MTSPFPAPPYYVEYAERETGDLVKLLFSNDQIVLLKFKGDNYEILTQDEFERSYREVS